MARSKHFIPYKRQRTRSLGSMSNWREPGNPTNASRAPGSQRAIHHLGRTASTRDKHGRTRHNVPTTHTRHGLPAPWRTLLKRGLVAASVFFVVIGMPSLAALAFHKTAHPDIETWLHTSDASVQLSVYHMATGQVTPISLNNYILNVLAAQFPPNTPINALEAASVACRTYAIRAKLADGTAAGTAAVDAANATFASEHGADVTDSGLLDLPMVTEQSVDARYGAAAATYVGQLETAIEATDGLILTYDNQPILAFTFALSPGWTRDAKEVFAGTSSASIPYLRAIACPDDVHAPNAQTVQTFSPAELSKALQLPAVNVAQFNISGMNSHGFVATVTYGHNVWTGARFASLLHLPSQNFTWQVAEGGLRVISRGFGTDIGMSLHEATAMAARGKSWMQILATFYPGTTRSLDVDNL